MKAVYLLGFRGAGKTTLGRALAERNSWRFVDLDEEWERKAGESILSFVEREGLEAFRKREEELLRHTDHHLRQGNGRETVILATGGGVVDWGPSRRLLEASPAVKIFLDSDEKALWERLRELPERREIGGLSDPEALHKLLSERRPHYEKIATYSLKNQDITLALTELDRLLGAHWLGA